MCICLGLLAFGLLAFGLLAFGLLAFGLLAFGLSALVYQYWVLIILISIGVIIDKHPYFFILGSRKHMCNKEKTCSQNTESKPKLKLGYFHSLY
jgi:hypothetical protein